MSEKDEKLSIENLDEAAGGNQILGFDPDNEQDLINNGKRISTPEYCCPQCGSKNVINYDPNEFLVMRVKCNDCGYFGERGSISETSID